MYRPSTLFRRTLAVVVGLLMVTFLPPLRNNLIPRWPRVWRPVPTLQLIKQQIDTVRGDLAALSSCTQLQETRQASKHAHLQTKGSMTEKKNQSWARSYVGLPDDAGVQEKARKWISGSKERFDRYSRFLPLMTLKDKGKLVQTWRTLDQACRQHNISYFLAEGTLLGAFRHQGIIPWDDDIDVAVHFKDADKLQHVLSCLPGYTLRVQSNLHWKFFGSEAKVVDCSSKEGIALHAKVLSEREKKDHVTEYQQFSDVVMRYPFVDIFLVQNDDRFTWARTNYIAKFIMFSNSDIYPLTETLFEGYMAPVPRHSRDILNLGMDPNQCVSPAHNHSKGVGITDISEVPCEELKPIYSVLAV